MRSLRARLLLLGLPAGFAVLAPLSAYALTYTTYTVGPPSQDIIKTTTPVDSAYGYDMSGSITIPTSVPPSTSYSITLSGMTLTGSANLICTGSCSAQAYATQPNSGTIAVQVYGGTGGTGSGTSGAAGTTGSIHVWTYPWDTAGGNPRCNLWSGNCRIPNSDLYYSVPVTSQPPTVSIWFN